MFAQDALAARYAKEAIDAGFDKQVRAFACARRRRGRARDRPRPQVVFPKRLFLYMPFEHGESAAMQERSIELFEAAAADAPEV